MFLENPQEYIGKKFNHTNIIEYIGKFSTQIYVFKCLCDCGREFYIKFKNKVRPCCASCQTKLNTINNKPKLYDYYGEKISLKDLSKKLNINYVSLYQRINRYKWNKDRWAEPVKRRNNA